MKYYKNIHRNYILSITTGSGDVEISEAEYNEILAIAKNCPTAPDGYGYRLKTDLTWELYELPPVPDVPTVEDKAEGFDILMGVSE